MGLQLVTPPTQEPLSLNEAKAHLRVTEPDDDGLITGYILAARGWAEGHIRSGIMTQTWDYTLDYEWPLVERNGYCGYRIELPLRPVQSVTYVHYVDENGTTQTLSSTLYTVHIKGPVAYIEKAYDASWPSVRWVPDAITVRFVCGYANQLVPDEIRTAIMLKVEALYDRCDEKSCVQSTAEMLLDPFVVPRAG